MDRPKLIAEGFQEDVANLLNEFVDRSTTEFSEFAEVWRKHHFSLVFMGRPDHTELSEFTNETYRLTSQYLSSPSFYQQVGAVYTLYALFRNQILTPTIKIRIQIDHWQTIKTLLIEAVMKKYKSLHYVIEYLIKNAFVYVAQQTLKGPLIGCMKKVPKSHETVSQLATLYKSNLIQYSITNNLSTLRDLHAKYYEEKKNASKFVKIHLNAAHEMYDKFISELNGIVRPKAREETLGCRRAKLKAQSFIRKTKDRFGQLNDAPSEKEIGDGDYIPKRTRKFRERRRRPKHERTVGRPSKKPKPKPPPTQNSDTEDLDISHLVPQQQDFYLPPPVEDENRKARLKRDYYYKVSPKRETSDSSDSDEPVVCQ